MKNLRLTIFAILGVAWFAQAQEQPKPINLSIYGYTNYEAVFDTRKVITAREGTVLLFPANVEEDPDGNDLNAVPEFNFLVLSSRIGTRITGPDAWGAEVMANFELDFLGTRADNFGLTRLRHAYIRLKWEKVEIMAGQYWHPLFVPACFPNMVSFAGGVPFHALNRSPQLRFTYTTRGWSVSAITLAQSDFPSLGPEGPSSRYIRSSMVPESFLQLGYRENEFLAGGMLGYQVLKPRLKTLAGYRTTETMSALEASIYATIPAGFVKIKVQGSYNENNSHLVMLGGYGEATLLDECKGIYDYAGIRVLSLWADVETVRKPLVMGLMAGYIRNLGSEKEISGEYWGRGTNIECMIRIAPRVTYTKGPVYTGLEFVYDVAAYGTPDARFRFSNTSNVSNLRTVVSIKYNFTK